MIPISRGTTLLAFSADWSAPIAFASLAKKRVRLARRAQEPIHSRNRAGFLKVMRRDDIFFPRFHSSTRQ
jgi:hypothetical protein